MITTDKAASWAIQHRKYIPMYVTYTLPNPLSRLRMAVRHECYLGKLPVTQTNMCLAGLPSRGSPA